MTNESEIGSISQGEAVLEQGANYLFAKNIKEVNINGLEIELNTKVSLADGNYFHGHLGYTFTDITSDNLGIYLSTFAKHLMVAQGNFKYHSFQFSLSGIYKERSTQIAESISSTLVRNYTLLNGRIGYEIDKGIFVNIQLINITNTIYQNILGAKMPGRWLMGGIKWNIK